MKQILKVCENGLGRIIPILLDEEFVGMFITLDSDNDDTLLIDYFAIKNDYTKMLKILFKEKRERNFTKIWALGKLI